jgi:hypothetical protein
MAEAGESIPVPGSHIFSRKGAIMNRIHAKLSLVFMASAAILALGGCSLIPGLNAVSSDIFNQVKKTTPVFGQTTAARGLGSGQAVARDFSSGDGGILYAVYYTLRDFNHDTDEGVVDRSNLYKLIYDVESVFEGGTWAAVGIGPKKVSAPFPKISSAALYEFGGTTSNSTVVYKKTGKTIDALLSWKWTETSSPKKDEIGIARFMSDPASGDIAIDFAFSVDYDKSSPAREYNNRCMVTGNLGSHQFQFKYRLGSNNIVAKGVSQGSGNMLFKYAVDGQPDAYLVVPAGAGMDFFSAEYASPSKAVTDPSLLSAGDQAAVADYVDWAKAEPYFTQDDMFDDTADLSGGSWKLAY